MYCHPEDFESFHLLYRTPDKPGERFPSDPYLFSVLKKEKSRMDEAGGTMCCHP